MQIDNLNTLSLIVFLCITGVGVFLLVQNYIRREKLKQIYKLLFTQSKLFYLRYIFLICSLIIITISIFKIGYYDNSKLKRGEGLDIVFVLDVSKSMNTRDVKIGGENYGRLEYSKLKISEYIVAHPDNRYALVIFAGDGISISPLTNNLDSLLGHLSVVSYTNIGKQGSDLAKALSLGYTRFGISESNTGKALVLISDGGDSDNAPDANILSGLNAQNIPTQILAVGSKSGGPIPIGIDPFGNALFQTYQGERVITRLNTAVLKNIADDINGEYNLLTHFNAQLDNISKKALQHAGEKHKQDIAGVLSMVAALFFTLYLLFPYYIAGRK